MRLLRARGARNLFFLAVLVLLCSVAPAEEEREITLKLGVSGGDNAMMARVADDIVHSLNDAAPGIAVTVLERPERGGVSSVWPSLRNGAVDAALVNVGEFAAQFDNLAGLNEPFLFLDADAAERFYTGGGGARIADVLERRGVTIAGWIGAETPSLLSRVPVESAEAFRGRTIAVGTNSRVAQDFTALGASVVSLPRERRLDAFFDGTYDMIEIEDFSWIGERDNSLAGVYAYSMESSFPYWALCFSGTGRARIPGESWSALFDAAREGTAAGVSLLAQAGSEGRSLFIEGGGECNVINLRSFIEDAPSDRSAAVARLDPVLKKELEEIAALKNLTDFGG